MKNKKNLLLALAVLMAIAATIFVGCKKEKDERDPVANDSLTEMGNMDDYLLAFKKKLLSAEKGEETLSIDQAQRDLGNLLNFDFGDANYATDKYQYDTLYVPLNLADDQIDMSQLAETYNSAVADIIEVYNRVDLPEKSISSISCLISNDSKDHKTAIVQLVVCTRGLSSYSFNYFDETDNWSVWGGRGKCDGTCVGEDHVSMLKKAYECTCPRQVCEHGGRIYYSDLSVHSIYADEFPESNLGVFYNCGNRLWSGTGSQANNDCIEYQEMQYYYNNFYQIMTNEAYRPQGHVIKSIVECTLEPFVSVNPDLFYSFCCQYQTGKPNCTNESLSY